MKIAFVSQDFEYLVGREQVLKTVSVMDDNGEVIVYFNLGWGPRGGFYFKEKTMNEKLPNNNILFNEELYKKIKRENINELNELFEELKQEWENKF